jgi:dTDP-L-rhamnose 4-epimerase
MKVADTLRDLLGSQSTLAVSGDFRAGDIRHCYADLTRAAEVLGFTPSLTVEQGLARFCAWVMTQPVLEDRSEKAMLELASLGLGRTQSSKQ